ncbi:MAG TPA: chemotaxis protein CheB [Sphingobacteriaceae bacterium]|nr:chemotaxis protein CheB [Sphingobacteriaceae bacterium]
MKKSGEKVKFDIVTIGGSAGSLQVALTILSKLDYPFSYSIIMVFHRKNSPTEATLTQLLQSKSIAPVKEAEDKEIILPGHIYVAPAGYHLLVEEDKSFSLDVSEKVNFSRPSIDITFSTTCEVYKDKTLAVILSGANRDGIRGMLKIKKYGGFCIAQDPTLAEVDYMPSQAIEFNACDLVATPEEIADFMNNK